MKKIVLYIFNLVLMLMGLPLCLWGLFRWIKIGFRFEPTFYVGNKDGTFFLFSIIIGPVAFMYGFFSLKFLKCRNKKEKEQLPNKGIQRIADKYGSR